MASTYFLDVGELDKEEHPSVGLLASTSKNKQPSRVHDNVIFYCGGRRKSVQLPILAVVRAESINSTSSRVLASVRVKVQVKVAAK